MANQGKVYTEYLTYKNIEFIDLSLLDLIFLERIVYAMQLKYYGIETIKIQNAINDLFRCGIALP